MSMMENLSSKKQTVYDWHRQDTRMTECGDICVTAAAGWGGGGNNMPYVLEERMTTDLTENQEPVLLESTQNHATISTTGISNTLSAAMGMGGGYVPMITQESERCSVSIGNGQLHDALSPSEEVSKTLNCLEDPGKIIETQYDNLVVRRLTPLECSRLQGYPDGWLDIGEWVDSKGKAHKDSDAPKYKAAGNSIALPFWQWLIYRIKAELDKDGIKEPTMASLFDGIGGFPLCSQRAGIKPVWTSEIEEYPIAVTKKHFGGE